MSKASLFLGLAVLGTVLPLSAFIPWLLTNGLDIPLFFQELFANRISAFFGWDVIVSALVVLAFIGIEGKRLGVPHLWAPLLGMCVGVSCSLPLFLWLRERHIASASPHS